MDSTAGCSDDYWTIYGKKYDLQSFVSHHPGGHIPIMLGKGTDATTLFEQYHMFNNKHVSTLGRIGNITDEEQPFANKNKFLEAVHNMVKEHFATKSCKTSNQMAMLLFVVGCCTLWSWKLWLEENFWSLILLPIFHWLFMVNTSHDASHFALSRDPTVNRIFSWTCVPFVFNTATWYVQHVTSHHLFTNQNNKDVDLDFAPLLRMHPEQASKKQTPAVSLLNCGFLSLFVCFALTIMNPLMAMFDQKHRSVPNRHIIFQHVQLELYAQFGLSLLYWCYPFWCGFRHPFLFAFVPYAIVSITFFVVTQSSHVNQRSHQHSSDDLQHMHWSESMLVTSIDYSTDSFAWTVVTGGLNMQTLHHVIPTVSSSHYLELYPKFRKLCSEFDLCVYEVPCLLDAFCNYVHHVIDLSSR